MATTKKPEPEAAPPGEDQAAAAAPAEPGPAKGPQVMEYLGGDVRTYLFDGAPPQTAGPGDVCEIPYDPGDGHWGPTTRKVNRLPDNHPDEAAKRSERQSILRNAVHALAAVPTEQAAATAGEA